MAEVKLNSVLEQLRGKVGDYVFRRMNGKVFVSRAPDFSNYKPTAAQKAQRRRFREANTHAKQVLSDPKARARYAARARRRGCAPNILVISEYLKANGK